MSYRIELMLKTVRPEMVLTEINAMQALKKSSLETPILACLGQFPSSFRNKEPYIDMERDEALLMELSLLKLIYWPEYNILGLMGNPKFHGEKLGKLFDTYVMFQNSTDTDYEYSVWEPISLFRSMLVPTTEDMTESEMYGARVETYDRIAKLLKIEDVLDDISYGTDKAPDVMRICVQTVPNPRMDLDIVSRYAAIHNRIWSARNQT